MVSHSAKRQGNSTTRQRVWTIREDRSVAVYLSRTLEEIFGAGNRGREPRVGPGGEVLSSRVVREPNLLLTSSVDFQQVSTYDLN